MRYWLVMPAAGVGRRFGNTKPKQYAPLQGRTVIEWALAPFLADPSCAGVSMSLAADDPYWGEVAARLTKQPGRVPELIFAGGGVERSHSVRKGLAALGNRAAADDWVLVHDAARPCLSPNDLQHLLDRLHSHPVGGLLATPAADTLKRASTEPYTRTKANPRSGSTAHSSAERRRGTYIRSEVLPKIEPDTSAKPRTSTDPQSKAQPRSGAESRTSIDPRSSVPSRTSAESHASAAAPGGSADPEVEQTVDRAGLWRALTPQMFRYELLCDALDRAIANGRLPTDEAQALEWVGEHPVLVQGSAANIKITSADDLVLAAALLNARENATVTR
jgi:2-C-methyl-D-erythritol 4-phosphate cytidylyltransferase